MATLALSLAGQVVGGLVGGPIGATIGRALGALAGSVVDDALFGEKPQPRAAQFRLQGSAEGGPIPRLYGWSRMTGNVIWATELEQIDEASSGAKGGLFGDDGSDDGPVLTANFAVAFCEGEVHRLGRIWADGQPLATEGLTLRFHRGRADQGVDSLIEAKQGTGRAPAYRGLCYLVFERLPIARFGNRIPNVSVELCRVVGELEPKITAITLIPGATEFGYDPEPRVRIVGPGVTASENTHLSAGTSDWTLSLDELQALCPNLKHVALVVAWFGDDLRCGNCTIRPKVENATRAIEGTSWSVAGLTRATAEVMTEHEGGPAYGGTPSDAAVSAAIADLSARGLAVTLYPIVLMDIAADNALPNPYGGSAQPAYPWRGRITCNPAPGLPGSVDQTGGVSAQIDSFVGTSGDWGFRRMLLHYAQLCADAGGVDAFLIGSELRGVSFLRDDLGGFPFVAALVSLSSEVRAIVGGATKLTYAADWSEFTGLQPADAPGDKVFHLDPLWASADIDAVGIDNYMPLADWRDGTDHADAASADGPYDPTYLSGNIAGGEGFDWFYASDADRIAGTRTPIADAAHGEPWVWRYKDLVSWWSTAHHNRIGGVRNASATAWVPQSKPIWFTELGCAATDKGANQPNIFGDAKSSENGAPYFSSGAPDGLIQRQFLRAHLNWWPDAAPGFEVANNPASGLYNGRMLDAERIYLWTWDARPYPAFPVEVGVWSDGVNHAAGHWLSGRLGALGSDELALAVAADYGTAFAITEAAAPLLHGLVVEGVMSCRDALDPLAAACGLRIHDTDAGLAIGRAKPRLTLELDASAVAATDNPLVSRRRPDPSETLGALALTYVDRERAYPSGTATALRLGGGTLANRASPLVLDLGGARVASERLLVDLATIGDTLEFSLPPSALAIEVGDAIAVSGQGEGPFEVTEIRDGAVRRISARAIPSGFATGFSADRPTALSQALVARALPLLAIAHLPPAIDAPTLSRLVIGAAADPWPGDIVLRHDGTGAEVGRVTRPAHLGKLASDLVWGPTHYWDTRTTLTVTLYAGHLSSVADEAARAGANRIAVLTDSGAWEIIGFANAELVAPRTYELSRLLRGQSGTGHAIGVAGTGNRVLVLNDRVVAAAVPSQWIGETLALTAYAGRNDPSGTALAVDVDPGPALPLAPAHARAFRTGFGSADVTLTWTRRSRGDADAWGLSDAPLEWGPEAYRVTILSGGSPVRSFYRTTPSAVYTAAAQTADFGTLPESFDFTISQLSAVLGPGHSAAGSYHV